MHRVEATMQLAASIEDETLLTRFINVLTYFRVGASLVICYLLYNVGRYSFIPIFLSITFVVYSKDIACIPVLIILELFRDRMRILRILTEQCLQDTRLRQENVRSKLLKIKRIVYIYKNLFDVIERQFYVLKFMITIKFAIEFRVCMVYVHTVLTNLIESRQITWDSNVLLNTLICGFHTVLPPLLFELSANEVDNIRTDLADQFLTCSEKEVREALLDALAYLSVRRVQCVVWRVLDIDASTPLTFLALVTNYVTVMIQFMKPQLDTS